MRPACACACLIALVLALCLTPRLRADEEPSAPPAPSAAAALAALRAEVEASKLGYVEKAAAFKPRFEALAAEHPGTPEELEAWLWLLQQTWWERADGTMNDSAGRIADRILAGHAASERLAELVELQYVFSAEQRAHYFDALLASSPHAGVKAAALFGLAQADLRGDEERQAKGRERLEQLIERFGAQPWRKTTYARIAKAYLARVPREELAVGKVAPEIEGENERGEAIKLSQFRGKVVLLGFWGDW